MSEGLDLAPIIVWAAGITTLLSLATTIWSLINSGTKKNAATLSAQKDRLDRQQDKIARLEQTVAGMPGKEDLHQLQLTMTEMSGDLRTMSAMMSGSREIMERLETIVSRHEEHLLEKSK